MTYFESGSHGIVTSTSVETSGGGVGEDGLVLAGSEVDRLDDLVDLVLGVTEGVKGLGPWELSLASLKGQKSTQGY